MNMKVFSRDKISTLPFFYIIQHRQSKKLYAGAKWSSHKEPCDSAIFMTEYGYKTTSKVVKEMIASDGINAFDIIRIRHFDNADSALAYESRFLARVDAMCNERFLNKSNGGKTFRCVKHTEETLQKLRGRKHTEETKLKMRESCKHRPPLSKEAREKISMYRKGRKMSVVTKEKLSLASKYRKAISEETRQRMSLSSRGRKISQEQKDRLRFINLGKKASTLTKEKMSKIHSGSRWWNNGNDTKFCKVSPGIEWKLGRKILS